MTLRNPTPGTVRLPFSRGSLPVLMNPPTAVPGVLNKRQLTSPQGYVERSVTGKRGCESCRGLLPISHGSSPPSLYQRRSGGLKPLDTRPTSLAFAQRPSPELLRAREKDEGRFKPGLVHLRRRQLVCPKMVQALGLDQSREVSRDSSRWSRDCYKEVFVPAGKCTSLESHPSSGRDGGKPATAVPPHPLLALVARPAGRFGVLLSAGGRALSKVTP